MNQIFISGYISSEVEYDFLLKKNSAKIVGSICKCKIRFGKKEKDELCLARLQ